MAFERTIEYQTVDRNAMLPFARTTIQGKEEDEDAFLKEKDDLFKAWREEDESSKRPRTASLSDDDFIDDDPMDSLSEHLSEIDLEDDEDEDDEYDEEEEEEDFDAEEEVVIV